MARKRKRKLPAVNRLVILIAAIVLLPVVVVVAYFGPGLLWTSADSQDDDVVGVRPQRQYVPRPAVPPPEPEGPILRPRKIEGNVITKLRPKVKPEDTSRYRIKDGDTLSAIAKEHYGDGTYVQDILVANPQIVSAHLIRAGQVITLPPRRGETATGEPVADRPSIYVVRPGDKLLDIATRHYGDAAMYRKIFEANRHLLSSVDAELREGMRLRLPPATDSD